MKGPKLSVLGYKIPLKESVKAIAETESTSKGIFLSSLHTLFKSSEIAYVKFPVPIYRINVLIYSQMQMTNQQMICQMWLQSI